MSASQIFGKAQGGHGGNPPYNPALLGNSPQVYPDHLHLPSKLGGAGKSGTHPQNTRCQRGTITGWKLSRPGSAQNPLEVHPGTLSGQYGMTVGTVIGRSRG